MKYLFSILALLLFSYCNAQEVKFSNKVYNAGDNVSITPKHLDPANNSITIKTDLSIQPEITVVSDKRVVLGKVQTDGIYNIQVSFDTIVSRYYQGLILAGADIGTTFKERIPFKLASADTAIKVIGALLDAFGTDTVYSKKLTKKAAVLVSFKLYVDTNKNATLVTSFFALSGDPSELQQFLKDINNALFKMRKPEYQDLFNTLFGGPSLMKPTDQVDLTRLSQFTLQQKKSKTIVQLYTKLSDSSYSFILNQP